MRRMRGMHVACVHAPKLPAVRACMHACRRACTCTRWRATQALSDPSDASGIATWSRLYWGTAGAADAQSSDPADVMSPYYKRGAVKLSDTDVTAVRALLGCD